MLPRWRVAAQATPCTTRQRPPRSFPKSEPARASSCVSFVKNSRVRVASRRRPSRFDRRAPKSWFYARARGSTGLLRVVIRLLSTEPRREQRIRVSDRDTLTKPRRSPRGLRRKRIDEAKRFVQRTACAEPYDRPGALVCSAHAVGLRERSSKISQLAPRRCAGRSHRRSSCPGEVVEDKNGQRSP